MKLLLNFPMLLMIATVALVFIVVYLPRNKNLTALASGMSEGLSFSSVIVAIGVGGLAVFFLLTQESPSILALLFFWVVLAATLFMLLWSAFVGLFLALVPVAQEAGRSIGAREKAAAKRFLRKHGRRIGQEIVREAFTGNRKRP